MHYAFSQRDFSNLVSDQNCLLTLAALYTEDESSRKRYRLVTEDSADARAGIKGAILQESPS
jgi:hypothetical protein